MKVVVFDLGGTLMEYRGMPLNWANYYPQGFEAINHKYHCGVSGQEIQRSVEILKSYNPRVNYREQEYTPAYIFAQALEHWGKELSPRECADTFYAGLNLCAEIYPDSVPVLTELKNRDCKTAALTDLPTAMPDDFFKRDIAGLLGHLDLYVSSQSCGYRKPNPAGLQKIAEHFGVPVDQLLFIGDEEKDRLTAENAGCRFIQIDRNSRCQEEFTENKKIYESFK